jgi:hypothetical protein
MQKRVESIRKRTEIKPTVCNVDAYHLADPFKVPPPAFLAPLFSFGMPPVLHHPTKAAHDDKKNVQSLMPNTMFALDRGCVVVARSQLCPDRYRLVESLSAATRDPRLCDTSRAPTTKDILYKYSYNQDNKSKRDFRQR